MVEHLKKTNKQWYAYPTLGAYFQMRQGNLWEIPMNADGSCGATEEATLVERNFIAEVRPQEGPELWEVVLELLEKA